MKKEESKIKGNSLGASGFTIAIFSIISLGMLGVILAITGFIFCLFQQKYKHTKLGKAGLILSIIGFVLSLIWLFYLGPIISEYALSQLNAYSTG